jgi:hypothetical protein
MLARGLDDAFDRLADFLAVWSHGLTAEAVGHLQAGVGIDADTRAVLARRLRDVQPQADEGAVLLGVLLGLSAAEEHRRRAG